MERLTLPNGLRLILHKRPSHTVTALLTVKVGSNYENERNNGISHFIEHMVFTGTKRRTALELASQIEMLGGELNAGTSPERTSYYVNSLPKHLAVSLDVLSDMAFYPIFPQPQIDTEKRVVGEEIDYLYDDLGFYQWVVFQGKLFRGPQRLPVYGTKQNIMRLTREELVEFHRKYYVPNNMVLTLTGNLPRNAIDLVSRYFSVKKGAPVERKNFREPRQTLQEHKLRVSTKSSYFVLGLKVPRRAHPDSLAFDIFQGVLGRPQSGWLFNEIRNRRGLAYSVGSHHAQGLEYNFFALYANLQERNLPKVKAVFLNEMEKLKHLNQPELDTAKAYIEGSFSVNNEENLSWAQTITLWELAGSARLCQQYVRRIKRIGLRKIRELASHYFRGKYCSIALVPKQG